jgi:hypothetical protein
MEGKREGQGGREREEERDRKRGRGINSLELLTFGFT